MLLFCFHLHPHNMKMSKDDTNNRCMSKASDKFDKDNFWDVTVSGAFAVMEGGMVAAQLLEKKTEQILITTIKYFCKPGPSAMGNSGSC